MPLTEVRFDVIIPAAGAGLRSGSELPKQYVELLGRPVLARTIDRFAELPGCRSIIVVVDSAWLQVASNCAEGKGIVHFVRGGSRRQQSVANALASMADDPDLILIHDAARPCVSRALIERVIAAARTNGAAIPALPITETVKRVDADGKVVETIPRDELRLIQTPQAFRPELLRRAHIAAAHDGFIATDDASLIEAIGETVRIVEGEPGNIKITVPEDFARAEEMIKDEG